MEQNNTIGQATPQPSPVAETIDRVLGNTERLDSALLRLHNKLETILTPENKPEADYANPPTPPRSLLADGLSGHANRLSRLAEFVEDISRRVEL